MDLLTVQETARLLKVTPTTVRRYITAGQLPAVKVGRRVRVRKEAVEDLLAPITPKQMRTHTREVGEGVRPVKEHEPMSLPEQADIWAGYDPERVRQALVASAGILRGVDVERLKADLAAQRVQDSAGRPA